MNRLSATMRLVNRWTSLVFFGDGSSAMAVIFRGFASIPLLVTIYPRNSPDVTTKVHFVGLSFILYLLRLSKQVVKCLMWLLAVRDLTSMSSM